MGVPTIATIFSLNRQHYNNSCCLLKLNYMISNNTHNHNNNHHHHMYMSGGYMSGPTFVHFQYIYNCICLLIGYQATG